MHTYCVSPEIKKNAIFLFKRQVKLFTYHFLHSSTKLQQNIHTAKHKILILVVNVDIWIENKKKFVRTSLSKTINRNQNIISNNKINVRLYAFKNIVLFDNHDIMSCCSILISQTFLFHPFLSTWHTTF